jgi:acyl-CoA thioesterase-1
MTARSAAAKLLALALLLLWPAAHVAEAAGPLSIVVLGDSLAAGLGLPAGQAFPARLEARLRARGVAVEVRNAGVSGDTSRAGLERLDWAVPEGTDAVILELGANDALRGIEPAETRANLAAILQRLRQRRIAVLIAGMRAPPNLGGQYAQAFNRIFPELAAEYGAALYPFLLEGVAADPALNQADGMHPNAAGADRIAERLADPVERLIKQLRP